MYTVPPVPVPAHLADVRRSRDLDDQAHAAGRLAGVIRCPCKFALTQWDDDRWAYVVSPSTGEHLNVDLRWVERDLPGLTERIRAGKGRVEFTPAELRTIVRSSERCLAHKIGRHQARQANEREQRMAWLGR